MVDIHGLESPLPDEQPVRSDEFTESDSERLVKDGAVNATLASKFPSELALNNQQADNVIGVNLKLNTKQLQWFENAARDFASQEVLQGNSLELNLDIKPQADKKRKLSFMDSSGKTLTPFVLETGDIYGACPDHGKTDSKSLYDEIMDEPSGWEGQEYNNNDTELRRALINEDHFTRLWNNTANNFGIDLGPEENSTGGFYGFVLRAHKLFVNTPSYYFKMTQFITGCISRNLSANNDFYWANRETFFDTAQKHAFEDAQCDENFSSWYDKMCSLISSLSDLKEQVLDHLVCAAMVAIYYAFENKATAIALSIGIFTLYYYRTGRNAFSNNVLTFLIRRLHKLFSGAVSTTFDYFGIGGKENQDASKIYQWLDFAAAQSGKVPLFATEAGDDGGDKDWSSRDVIKTIEGFYKELTNYKLTPLLMGVTGVIAMSGFCAITGRPHEEIADFDVSDYMQLPIERIGTVSQVWDAIKAIYSDVRIYFEFKYRCDKKRSFLEFRQLRQKLIEWEDKGKDLAIYIPDAMWASLDVVKQLQWRMNYCEFREYAVNELMANKQFEVVQAIYGQSPRVLRIKTMYTALHNHYMAILSHRFRPASIGFIIEGGTGIAKSTLLLMMQQFILNHHLKIPLSLIKQLTYYYTEDDSAFWDGATSSHLLCVMDDVDKYVQDIEPEGNKGIKALLAIMNNLPFNLNQAQLELKGKVYALYYAIIATSNTITGQGGRHTLDMPSYYKHPGAVNRRFNLVIQVRPTVQFDNGSGAIDTKKLADWQRDNPNIPPDAWRIKCLRTIATNNGYEVSQPEYVTVPNARLIEECGDVVSARRQYGDAVNYHNVVDFLNMLATQLEEHDRVQQSFFEVSESGKGYDFTAAGIRETEGVPQSFKDMLGQSDGSAVRPPNTGTDFTTESGLMENPGTRAYFWPMGLFVAVLIWHLAAWLYRTAIHIWYTVYDAYQQIWQFFVIARRIGGFYQTILYYRDSARLNTWVNNHKLVIAGFAGTSLVTAVLYKVYQQFSKKDAEELQSGNTVRTVPVPHGIDLLPAYQPPRFTPSLSLSGESTSIQEGHMITSCGKNKTFIAKMTFFDPSDFASNDTHATIFSYSGNKPPRAFFNRHALEKWTSKHAGPWYVKIYGVLANSNEPAIFPDTHFYSHLVKLPAGDTRDLVILDLVLPPGAKQCIRNFKHNEQYLLSKDNFIDAKGQMVDAVIQNKVSFVRLTDGAMQIHSGGLVTQVHDDFGVESSGKTYKMGSCMRIQLKVPTGPGDCGSPYLLQRVNCNNKIIECAFIAIHGAGSPNSSHTDKLAVPVYADDMVLPSPVLQESPPLVADVFAAQGADESVQRREVFKYYETKASQFPVPENMIMHLPTIIRKANGEINQHDKSKKIEETAAMLSSLHQPVGEYVRSAAQWVSDILGRKCPVINRHSAHLYGTCKTIDVKTPEGCGTYIVGIGKLDSDWHTSPLYGDLNGHVLSSVNEVIKTSKKPPKDHVAHIKKVKCLEGEIDYQKLNEKKLSEYDIAMILSDIMKQPEYDPDLADKMLTATDHYLDMVLKHINVSEEIKIFPMDEGIPINGYVNEQGVRARSLEGVDMKTSPGPPMTSMRPGAKGKLDWFYVIMMHEDGRVDYGMGDTLAYFVNECRSRMYEAHRVVAQIYWKDEPSNPESEEGRKPKRPIFVLPLYFNLLMREYLLSINRTMAAFPFVFQQAVGFDSSSEQWAQIHHYVFGSNSTNFVFDGDYRKFDRGLLQEVTDAVRYFIITLCQKSGNYNEKDLVITNNILKAATSPVVNVFGTLYNFRSLNTSGNPLTTQINCLANNILIWYVFLEKYNQLNYGDAHMLYVTYVRAMTYGDDNIVGCVPHPDYGQVITCKDMQERLKGIIDYTDAAKNSIVEEYAKHEDVTLLGRYFSKSDNKIIDRFELKRLWRMLLTYQHRSSRPVQICLRDIYDSALYELARYNSDLFNEVRELLIAGLKKYQEEVTGNEYSRTEIVQAFFTSNRGIEQTYEFYREKYEEHNRHGFIKDPRYAEVCPDEFSTQSGECYFMNELPFNATEFERRCFIEQNFGLVPVICGPDYFGTVCGLIVVILTSIAQWVLYITDRFTPALGLYYAFRNRPMLQPGPILCYFIGWVWRSGVSAELQ
ncbi:hypothetical protein 1 [Wenzhou picorna-like virus 19]|uniref:hypothetical protein 1 n=1 Tax=Wenzhou picorna-like virus 19 TaxID=1923603 RepID=UPI00090A3648|nr:hypothetical protein 1 [Wenzhou picorna-like virus 19]APG78591.1 hypothetical protein 1 [Wenzhou picorna-like virus 19]